MFERTLGLINEELLNKIKNSRILIVGLGGVGASALIELARLGIENFIILDNDKYELSNINRQMFANINTIGKNKVDIAKKEILLINSNIQCETINTFLTKDNINNLDKYTIDYIIDACDTITTKKELIKYAKPNNIKIISIMGTGNRFNPSMLEITTLNKTNNDGLAKNLRHICKTDNIDLNIPVIWSREEPQKISNRTPASLPFVPNVAGILAAYYIFNDIKTSSI